MLTLNADIRHRHTDSLTDPAMMVAPRCSLIPSMSDSCQFLNLTHVRHQRPLSSSPRCQLVNCQITIFKLIYLIELLQPEVPLHLHLDEMQFKVIPSGGIVTDWQAIRPFCCWLNFAQCISYFVLSFYSQVMSSTIFASLLGFPSHRV